jgi:tRNA dimethylallyltransferase
MLHQKTIIVIVGPTASGKTSLAIQLAKKFNTKIVSADSRQCFKETTIGVAKPNREELESIEHFFIDSYSIHDTVNAGVYEQYALEKLNEIFKHHHLAVVVGGTGLYIKALCEGLDAMPPIDETIRENIIKNYEKNGLLWLQQQLQINDNLYWEKGEIQNPQRLMRALAVKLSTKESILNFQKKERIARPFNIIKIGLNLDKQQLHKNIHQRVDKMMDDGLLDEAKKLYQHKTLNALQTVGYQELFDYFDGKHDVAKAVELIKTHTRQYAKRQMTWFKKDESIKWFNTIEAGKIISFIDEQLKNTL